MRPERNLRRGGSEALPMSSTLTAPPRPFAIAWPWLDRGRRFSWPRMLLLVSLLAPGLVLLAMLADGALGAEPWKAAMREAGSWALWGLLLTMLVTPLRWIADAPKIATLRRMVGLVAS